MPEMLLSNAPDAVADVTQAAIANATGDLVTATYVLAAAGLLVGLLQVHVVWRGIDKMTEANEKRDKRHNKSMKAEARRHKKTMKAETRRHTEAMDAEANRHKESMRALNALIRNSGRRNRPIPAR